MTTTWSQRRRVANETAARVAGPAAREETALSRVAMTATVIGQRRRK